MPAFPAWLMWVLLLVVIWLLFMVSMLRGQLQNAQPRFTSRQDLEAAYTKGTISRDDYERYKGRLS